MTMPGFTADTALDPTVEKYRGRGSSASSGTERIVPQWRCNGYRCTCSGDNDCNWMFTSGACERGGVRLL
jgi:hypothetical protein